MNCIHIKYFETTTESECEFLGVPDEGIVATLNRFFEYMKFKGHYPVIQSITVKYEN